MQSTITVRGQTVIPAEIRRHFQLGQQDRLEWVIDGNTLRIVPVKKSPVEAFRERGKGGATGRLLAERSPTF
jgi:AbrB family looped-hinge helix DNA binding protein